MTRPDEDEFLSSPGLPSWLRWTAGVAAAAVLVTLAVVKTASQPSGAPSASPAPTASFPRVVVGPVPLHDTQPVTLPSSELRPADVVTEAGVTWVLQGHLLLRRSIGYLHWQAVSIKGRTGGDTRLMLDPDTRELWLADLGRAPAQLRVFDARNLRALASWSWPRRVISAAPVRGSLYVADARGLFRIAVDGSSTRIDVPWARHVITMVADPGRDRTLLLISAGAEVRVAVLGEVEPVEPAEVPYPVAKPAVGVTAAGQIWLAGFGHSGAVLFRLDPRTLRPMGASPLVDRLGPGAVLLASGTDTLLVANGGGVAALWCIDGVDGAPLQQWQLLAGRAGLNSGLGYAIVATGLVRLDLAGRCTG